MTLISFFDEDPLDNIGDILYLKPDTCVFIGESSVISKQRRKTINRFLSSRGLPTQTKFFTILCGDMEEAKDRLARLVMEYPDCIFDVTGGTEMMIALAGIVAEKCEIPIYQRKGQSCEILWQRGCKLSPTAEFLTVSEVVSLHSGSILHSYPMPKFDGELRKWIPVLWNVSRKNPEAYNSLCNGLAFLMGKNESSKALELVVSSQSYDRAPSIDTELLRSLEKAGLIRDLDADWGGLSLQFRSQEIRDVLTKAGLLLELATCLAAEQADDRAAGVSLDWDGADPEDSVIQTRNELDVMLTFGIVPVCISCKNGLATKEALYELDTVSRHFAGRFAVRILVASYVDRDSKSVEHLMQRAKDMNIVPLFNVHEYSFAEFSQELQKHFPH